MFKFNSTAIVAGVGLGLLSLVCWSPVGRAADPPAVTGGMAGSASFGLTTNAVNGVGISAAIGENGASAWSFNGPTNNSAGSIGSQGKITIGDTTGFTATQVDKVVDNITAGTPPADGTVIGVGAGPDLLLGSSQTGEETVINMP